MQRDQSDMQLRDDSVAAVTGATSGIGEAFARELARRECDLLITGRREEKIMGVAQSITESSGAGVEVFLADFTDENTVRELSETLSSLSKLDVLINNAGFDRARLFHEQELQTWQDMVQVHVQAAMGLTHAVLPGMIERERGAVINVSSLASYTPLPFHATYSATKSFLKCFSEALHMELRDTDVRVQALCPGITRSEIHKRMGLDPEKVYKDRGFWKTMEPADVVCQSLTALEKDRPVCVPGPNNRCVAFLSSLLPQSIVHWASEAFAKSQF